MTLADSIDELEDEIVKRSIEDRYLVKLPVEL